MSGHHAHDPEIGRWRLPLALVATALIAALEIAGGIVAHSLALLSDAAHVAMDVVALAIALAATMQASRPANERQTYGFARLEILAALANGALLLAVTVLIVVEAIKRFIHPELPHGNIMAAIAAIGLIVNVGVGVLLMKGTRASLNMRAALLHVAGDGLGATAVLIGGAVIAFTGAAWIDPALSLLVSAIIVLGVARIFREATFVLLESVPAHAALRDVREAMCACSGVVTVHDLHVWSLGSGSHALSAHVVVPDRRVSDATALLRVITTELHDRFAIDHVTLQFECESCDEDERIVCTQTPTLARRPS
jgi:cobalt-zinc-cadmium efflux system protein